MSRQYASLGLPDLDRLARRLALFVRPGDMIALCGDLGAGKTTFARCLIGALQGAGEVPSPSFPLVQAYETPRLLVHHFDLYRLKEASELDELGFDAAIAQGLVLVEWPQRAEARMPAERLEVVLSETGSPDARTLDLIPHGERWRRRIERLAAVEDFLSGAGWGKAHASYLQGDASPRAYARLALAEQRAVLMDAPRQPDGPPVRDGKPYSRIAHLAEDVRPFVAVGTWLVAQGLSAPRILAHDLARGLLLLEDLGDRVFGREVEAGRPLDELYPAAVDVLLALRRAPLPAVLPLPGGGSHRLPPYDRGVLAIEVELLLDWYWPALTGTPASAELRAEFLALWAPLFDRLLALPRHIVLRDFHSPNLMWLEERTGPARVGLLDFQDALIGHPAFDLVSLLQDARLDVPAELEAAELARYCDTASAEEAAFDERSFRFAYAVLGAQRNTKILGIFARLAKRDGKRAYLRHIPRIWGYLERNLGHPDLAPLAAWYGRRFPGPERARPLDL